jgi:hypothetical protein
MQMCALIDGPKGMPAQKAAKEVVKELPLNENQRNAAVERLRKRWPREKKIVREKVGRLALETSDETPA